MIHFWHKWSKWEDVGPVRDRTYERGHGGEFSRVLNHGMQQQRRCAICGQVQLRVEWAI